MTFKIAAVLLPLIIFTTSQSFAQYKVKRYSAIVRTVDGKRLKGLFEAVGDSSLTIRYHKKSSRIAADSIERIRIKRYNAQNRSFLRGGLLGLAGGLTVYKLESDRGNIGPIILPVVVVSSIVSGAAFFATVNSLTSKARFKDVNQPGNYESIRPMLKKYSLNR